MGLPSVVVMQFNVLADGLAQGQFGSRVPEEVLAHPRRFKAALVEVARVAPDVLCLQEVNHYHDFWAPEMRSMGYDGVFIPKYAPEYPEPHRSTPDYYRGNPSDGCAIFALRERFSLGRRVLKRFADLLDDAKMTQTVLAVELSDTVTGQHVLTASTSHLKAMPGEANAQVRMRQCRAWVRLLTGGEGLRGPFVVTGDMNEPPVQPGAVTTLCEGLGLRSAYAADDGREPPFTCIDGKWRDCLDFILMPAGMEPSKLWAIPDLADGDVPSALYPSDHLAIAAEFQLRVP